MTNFMCVVFIFVSIQGAFAGELRNKKTQEYLGLKTNEESLEIRLESAEGNQTRTITKKLFKESLVKKQTQIRKGYEYNTGVHTKDEFYLTKVMASDLGTEFLYLMPLLVFPLAIDIAFLPVKLPLKLVTDQKLKKDIRILNDVLATDKSIDVSHLRFERIKRYLGI